LFEETPVPNTDAELIRPLLLDSKIDNTFYFPNGGYIQFTLLRDDAGYRNRFGVALVDSSNSIIPYTRFDVFADVRIGQNAHNVGDTVTIGPFPSKSRVVFYLIPNGDDKANSVCPGAYECMKNLGFQGDLWYCFIINHCFVNINEKVMTNYQAARYSMDSLNVGRAFRHAAIVKDASSGDYYLGFNDYSVLQFRNLIVRMKTLVDQPHIPRVCGAKDPDCFTPYYLQCLPSGFKCPTGTKPLIFKNINVNIENCLFINCPHMELSHSNMHMKNVTFKGSAPETIDDFISVTGHSSLTLRSVTFHSVQAGNSIINVYSSIDDDISMFDAEGLSYVGERHVAYEGNYILQMSYKDDLQGEIFGICINCTFSKITGAGLVNVIQLSSDQKESRTPALDLLMVNPQFTGIELSNGENIIETSGFLTVEIENASIALVKSSLGKFNAASVTITNLHLDGSLGSSGCLIFEKSTVKITDSKFYSCTGTNPGIAINMINTAATITNVLITLHRSVGFETVAAVYSGFGSLTELTNVNITNGKASGFLKSELSNVNLNNVRVFNNTGTAGTAIFFRNSRIICRDCLVDSNVGLPGSTYGTIYIENYGSIEFYGRSRIVNNKADHYGGAIFHFSVVDSVNPATVVLSDETLIANNSAGSDGGGLYLNEQSTLHILGPNVVIRDNFAKHAGSDCYFSELPVITGENAKLGTVFVPRGFNYGPIEALIDPKATTLYSIFTEFRAFTESGLDFFPSIVVEFYDSFNRSLYNPLKPIHVAITEKTTAITGETSLSSKSSRFVFNVEPKTKKSLYEFMVTAEGDSNDFSPMKASISLKISGDHFQSNRDDNNVSNNTSVIALSLSLSFAIVGIFAMFLVMKRRSSNGVKFKLLPKDYQEALIESSNQVIP
jgi:hypothetical protein